MLPIHIHDQHCEPNPACFHFQPDADFVLVRSRTLVKDLVCMVCVVCVVCVWCVCGLYALLGARGRGRLGESRYRASVEVEDDRFHTGCFFQCEMNYVRVMHLKPTPHTYTRCIHRPGSMAVRAAHRTLSE